VGGEHRGHYKAIAARPQRCWRSGGHCSILGPMRIFLLLCLAFALPACKSGPALPPGDGRGLVAADSEPPAGAEVFQRPSWRVGDRMVLLVGGQRRLEISVTRADATGYDLQNAKSGFRQRLDQDLAVLADLPAPDQGDEPLRVSAPRDVRFHWPLWVGKRWRCHFLLKATEGDPMPLEVSYEVEGIDTVRVPAGSFRCLRILRVVSFAGEDERRGLQKAGAIWYAPDPGVEVRQLVEGSMIELAEWTRAGDTPKGG
jgi:hypothetical protein